MGDLLQTLPFKQFLKEPEPDGKYEIIQQGNEPVIGFANGTPCGDYKDVVIFGDHTLSLYKPQHPFFVATDGVRIVKGQQDTDGYYLLSLLERYKPQSEGYKRYYSILADTNCITTYNTSEQEKIGVFFKLLDNLITLHQRKFEKLTNVKKSMLEKMFPQNGSSYPEIRFKGFTDPWEQRKFDEVFDCTVPNNTLSRAELSYDEGTVLNVHYGDVLIKYGSVLDVQKDDIPRIPHRCREDFNGALLQDGDVIIADTAEDETTGKACEIGNLQGSAIVSGLHTMVCRPRNRMALGYLGYYLNSNAYHHQLLPLMQGIKVLSLSRSNIQKTSVSYPIAVKEQQLIAYYFSQLDNLITLHQRKGKAAVTGCSNDANNSKGVYCKARDFGYKCYKKVKSQQIRCLIAVFIFFV